MLAALVALRLGVAKLETAGYINLDKTFVNRRPKTFLSATDRGRAAFADNVAALREIMAIAEQPKADE